MPILRDIKQRISGVQKTQTITRALKMVAAVKLRRAQQAIIQARPFLKGIAEKKDLDQDLQAGLTAACQDFMESFTF